jgi:putative transposase
VHPETQVQLCIIHIVRNSLRFVQWKDKKDVVVDLKTVYTAINVEEANKNLNEFRTKWNEKNPTIANS